MSSLPFPKENHQAEDILMYLYLGIFPQVPCDACLIKNPLVCIGKVKLTPLPCELFFFPSRFRLMCHWGLVLLLLLLLSRLYLSAVTEVFLRDGSLSSCTPVSAA